LDSPVHRLNARVKILFFIGTIIVCVSTPADRWPAFLGYFAILLAVLLASSLPMRHVAMRILLVAPFILLTLVSVPFMGSTGGGSYSLGVGGLHVSRSGLLILWNVAAKASLCVLCVILLTSTTKFSKLLAGLGALRVPAIFTMLQGFAYRFIFIIEDEAERMKRAGDSRGYAGRWLWHARTIGRMIGALFLRSYERAERVHAAMISRGFDGTAVASEVEPVRGADYAFLCAGAVVVLGLRILAK
jgi:cobalt/nickel transport system permease protein